MEEIVAYTVDRSRSLFAGQALDLQRHDDVDPKELQTHADSLFPNGFSEHGERYFLQAGQEAHLADPNIELIWEYVRRSFFPGRPSRFTSLFAFPSPEEARAWRTGFGNSDDPIWVVSCDEGFVADMSLLTQAGSILIVSYLSHLYWEGLSHPDIDSVWEYLLVPPISVVSQLS